MGTLNLTAVTPDTPYIKKIKSALEKATGQSIPLVEVKKVQRKSGVSALPVFFRFAGAQELTLYVRASADVFKSELNGKEIVLPGDFSDDYQMTFDNAVSGVAQLVRNSQAKIQQQNKNDKVKLPPRKSIQQQISDKREEETQLDQELSNLTSQRDQLLEQLKQAQAQKEGGEATQGKQIAEGQSSAFDSVDWDEKQHPRDENGKFSVKSRLLEKYPLNTMPSFRTDWGNFPNVIIAHPTGTISDHPKYQSAKSGNFNDAFDVVEDFLTKDTLVQIKALLKQYPNTIIAPVHAEELTGRNQLPVAFAAILNWYLGNDIDSNIVQSERVFRTQADGFSRLVKSVSFNGDVKRGKTYLILDDAITQGGTLADFRGYIEHNGGSVIAASVLMGKPHSAKLAITKPTLGQLRKLVGKSLEDWWYEQFGYKFSSLTESEARYIAKQVHRYGFDETRSRIFKARFEELNKDRSSSDF